MPRWLSHGAWLIVALPNLAVIDRLWTVWSATAPDPHRLDGLRIGIMGLYLAFVAGAAPKLTQWFAAQLAGRTRLVHLGGAVLVALALLATASVYPRVDSGAYGFRSDRDEAIDVGTRQLLAGRDPYACRVVSGEHHACLREGNPIGPLPGAFVLSAPFVELFGAGAFQNVFWLAVFLLVVGRSMRADLAGSTIGPAFLLSPIFWAEIVTGGDLLADTLAVTTLSYLLMKRDVFDRIAFALAVGLGVALAWRANFVLILPCLVGVAARRWGIGRAIASVAISIVCFAMLSLPFYFADPANFGPLLVQQKLRDLVGADGQFFAIAIGGAVAAAWALRARTLAEGLAGCAVVLVLPSLFAVAFASAASARFDVAFYGWYALSASFYALLALLEWPSAKSGTVGGPPGAGVQCSADL